MNILMPMAGQGLRLLNAGYELPKPLIQVCGKTIVEWSINTLGLEGNFIFCCKKEHIETFDLKKKLSNIIPNCIVVSIEKDTEGTADTILHAKEFIDNNDELFISDSDHYMLWNNSEFRNKIKDKHVDACVMTYPDKQTSNAYSYVKFDREGFVTEAAEKIPISSTAAAGMHYYKKGSDFIKYANKMISNNIRFSNEFYVTPIYNEFIKDNKKIISFPINKKWPLGNPDEIKQFEKDFSRIQHLE